MLQNQFRILLCIPAMLMASGCMEALEDQVKSSNGSSVKSTQEIGEFDPNANLKISDSKIRATGPVSAAMAARVRMQEKIGKLNTDYAVRLFHAEQGRYPKDYDEFMSQIIKKNNMRLPELPPSLEYQYDVENHRLNVVEVKQPQ